MPYPKARAVGILDFIKPKSALEKAAKQVKEEYAQPDYRRGAMDKLLELGTPEAYAALLERFTVKANGQIADEQEKKELVEELVKLGDRAIPPLETFLAEKKKSLTFPLRAYVRIRGRDAATEDLLGFLKARDPLDHRSTEAKVALIDALADLLDPPQVSELYPYLDDHHDDVQAAVIEVVERLKPSDAAEPLAAVCGSDIHSGRTKRRAAQALVSLELPVRAHFEGFDAELKSAYVLGKKGQLVARPSP